MCGAFVRNNTTLARNDADRICVNSSTMHEGLRSQPQPAWYVGYNNAAAPSDGSVMTASVRYGFRGSKNMLQYMTKPYELPSKTRTEHTPQFLQADADYVDEYVPPVLMTTAQTINNMEAPRLWPENTEYVTGYPKKKLPSIWRYKRETTVDLPERPASPPDLSHVFSRMTLERQSLVDKAKQERTVLAHTTLATSLGRPATQPAKANAADRLPQFQSSWRDTLERCGSASLKRTMREDEKVLAGLAPPRHYLPSRLLDPTDRMRYSGSTAVIVHSQSNDELAFRFRMERVTERCTSPQYLQWQAVNATFDSMSRKLKRGQTMEQTLDKIALLLHEVAMHSGSETSIRRVDFVSHMSKLSFLGDDASAKTLSHLYSTFDPLKKNALRFVELLLRWKVLVCPETHLVEKFRRLWQWALLYGADRSVVDRVVDVLCLCCGSNADRDEVERLFRDEFKPRCLELAVLGKSALDDVHATVLGAHNPNSTTHTARATTATSASAAAAATATTGDGAAPPPSSRRTVRVVAPVVDAAAEAPLHRPSSATGDGDGDVAQTADAAPASASTLSAFHVAEHFLATPQPVPQVQRSAGSLKAALTQPQTFPEPGFMLTLRLCPQLLALLDRLLHERLVQAYGKDERRVREEAERERELRNQAAEKQDFTWIINQPSASRPRPARAVLSLFESPDDP